MTNAISLPVRALVFTFLGLLVAFGWYRWSRFAVVVLVSVALLALASIQLLAKSKIVHNPVGALRMLETRTLSIAAMTALLGAIATVVGIEMAAPDGTSEPNKTLIGGAVAAITAFISSISITEDKM